LFSFVWFSTVGKELARGVAEGALPRGRCPGALPLALIRRPFGANKILKPQRGEINIAWGNAPGD